ncbi:DUF6215 domain-containing protein [Streptomyces sp. NPDC002308]
MDGRTGVPERGTNPWGQAVSAVVLVGMLGGGLWAIGETANTGTDTEARPATCSPDEDGRSGEDTTRGKNGDALLAVSGFELCSALNRPDLAELLDATGEIAQSASGSGGPPQSSESKDEGTDDPSARVELGPYTVTLAVSHDGLPAAALVTVLGDTARQRTVLGRPAVLYSDRTISLSFRLDGSDARSAPGVPSRVLSVDAEHGGESVEVAMWREDGWEPDEATLLRVAEAVLPTIPGWAAGAEVRDSP